MSNNTVVLKGRLGSKPDVRQTSTGKSVTNLNLAVQDGFGENKKTFWVNVVFWGSLADRAGEELDKGSEISVIGKLQTRKYKNKSDQEVNVTEVVGSSFGYVEAREKKSQQESVDDSDIPF